jgi:hypothetical protein
VVLSQVVIQIINAILQPEWILLIVLQERMVETELWHLGLRICQDDLMCHRGFLLRDRLHMAFFVDLLRYGSRGAGGGGVAAGGAAASPPSSASFSSSPMRSSPVSLAISISSSPQDSTISSRVAFSSSNL